MKFFDKLFKSSRKEIWTGSNLYRIWCGFAWIPRIHPFSGKWFWLQRVKTEEIYLGLFGNFGTVDVCKESEDTYSEMLSRLESEVFN